MKIHLHIERLVLDGVGVEQPRALRQALQQALANRVVEGGLSAQLRRSSDIPHMRVGTVDLWRKPAPARLGAQIADAVYRGIGQKR
jgi:hypothetical protein